MSVQNKMAPIFSIMLQGLTLIFLENAKNCRLNWGSELNGDVSSDISPTSASISSEVPNTEKLMKAHAIGGVLLLFRGVWNL